MTRSKEPCKNVWSVYARYGNKPAGFLDTVLTKEEAHEVCRRSRMSCRIKRDCIPMSVYNKMKQGLSWRQAHNAVRDIGYSGYTPRTLCVSRGRNGQLKRHRCGR